MHEHIIRTLTIRNIIIADILSHKDYDEGFVRIYA